MLILRMAKFLYICYLVNTVFYNYDEIICQMFIAAQQTYQKEK